MTSVGLYPNHCVTSCQIYDDSSLLASGTVSGNQCNFTSGFIPSASQKYGLVSNGKSDDCLSYVSGVSYPQFGTYIYWHNGLSDEGGDGSPPWVGEVGVIYYFTNITVTTSGAADTTPPVTSDYNCTSCNPPNGDNQSPYETDDTTPTFNFTTDKDARCVIGVNDTNYTTMNITNSGTCNSGEETKSHICRCFPFFIRYLYSN